MEYDRVSTTSSHGNADDDELDDRALATLNALHSRGYDDGLTDGEECSSVSDLSNLSTYTDKGIIRNYP